MSIKKVNDKSLALRFLILRHIWLIRKFISNSLFMEVIKSLKISYENKIYKITWKKNKIEYEKNFEDAKFSFYKRGDRLVSNSEFNEKNQSDMNNIEAKKIVGEIFRLNQSLFDINKKENLLTFNPLKFLSFILFPIFFYYYNNFSILISIIFFTLHIIEYINFKLKTLILPIAISLFFLELNFTAFIIIFFFLIVIIFDPMKFNRNLNFFLSILLLIYSFHNLNFLININYDLNFLIITIFCCVIFFFILLHGSHFVSYNLIYPFLSIGLYLDLGLVNVIFHMISSVIILLSIYFSHYLFKVQKEETLNPNG